MHVRIYIIYGMILYHAVCGCDRCLYLSYIIIHMCAVCIILCCLSLYITHQLQGVCTMMVPLHESNHSSSLSPHCGWTMRTQTSSCLLRGRVGDSVRTGCTPPSNNISQMNLIISRIGGNWSVTLVRDCLFSEKGRNHTHPHTIIDLMSLTT